MVSGVVCMQLILSHYFLHMYLVVDTSDVVPSGTIPATPSTSALSPTPTAPAETAGELILVLKTCLFPWVSFGLSQTSAAHHHSVLNAYTLCYLHWINQCALHVSTHKSSYANTHTETFAYTVLWTPPNSRQCLCILHIKELVVECNPRLFPATVVPERLPSLLYVYCMQI